MANRFVNPFPQFMASTGAALSGAKLFFYGSGGGVKLSTYSRSTLMGPANANPVVLNAAGFPPVNIFLQDLAYRVVLASATDTDPPTSPIWVADPVYASDFSTIGRVQTFPGNPNGFVAGTAGSGSTPADEIFDTVNKILYIATTTGDAVTTVWTAINQPTTSVLPPPQGRLTPLIGDPVILIDAVSVGSVFYENYAGNLVPIYNGTIFTGQAVPQLGLTLTAGAHAAATIYDVFIFMVAGSPQIGTGPAWTNSAAGTGTRGAGGGTTELTRLSGILVNAAQITARNGANTFVVPANTATYVGSILIDSGAAGVVTCHTSFGQNRRWGVWNAHNRVPIILRAGDAAANWSYNTNTIRASNNSAANNLTTFCGLPEEEVALDFTQGIQIAAGAAAGTVNLINTFMGIGVNSTTVYSGKNGFFSIHKDNSFDCAGTGDGKAAHTLTPFIGINTITSLEQGTGASNTIVTWQGSSAGMQLRANWRG